jgi:DNA-binding transcriptional MocR family regulator
MKLLDIKLSEYGKSSSAPAPVNRMMAEFAADFREDRDINLGVGYVNERTIPRGLIKKSMREVLAHPEKYKAALNYGGPHGSPNLIESIRKYYLENKIGGLTENILKRKKIIIGPNGATSLLEGTAQLLKPGIVITPDPMYYIYCNFLERMGYELVTVPEDKDGIRIDILLKKLKELGSRKNALSFFYVVSINNPTCSILSNERKYQLVRIVSELSAKLKRKIPLIIDKAYEDLVHDKSAGPLQSAMIYDEDGLVYEIGTLSKILSPALRIGYMIGNDSVFLQAMVQKTSDAGFSAPLINQEIASYLLDYEVSTQIEKVNRGYRIKALRVNKWIEEMLGDFLEESSGGKAGFYYYLTFKNIKTAEGSGFFRYLSRTTDSIEIDGPAKNRNPRVLYIPGEFCVHPEGDLVKKGKRQLRLSYGFEELERIKQALWFMRQAAEYAATL